MLKHVMLALALTLAAGGAQAGTDEPSRMYNPGDNPVNSPTPHEFNQQEFERRRAHGLCANLFECASGGATGQTYSPDAVYRSGYAPRSEAPYHPRYRRHRSYH